MKLLQGLVLGTFFLIVGGIVALFALGLRPGAGTLVSDITIARPPAIVWRWLTEPVRIARWTSWVADVKQDSLAPGAAGSRQSWQLVDPNLHDRVPITGTVTEQDAPRMLRMQVRTPGLFESVRTWTLEPVAGGTHLSQTERVHYDVWAARFMEPLVTPQAQRRMAGDQARLKQLAESAPAAPESLAR